MAPRRSANGSNGSIQPLISELRVKGFKSIATEQRLVIRPLTILAGANSSGKSSMMQPALLIKQTLESSYDPGALSINGPNVKMTEFRQLFWGTGTNRPTDSIEITLDGRETGLTLKFAEGESGGELREQVMGHGPQKRVLRPEMSQEGLRRLAPVSLNSRTETLSTLRDRCFLVLKIENNTELVRGHVLDRDPAVEAARSFARKLIHVPGLRPWTAERGERVYPKAAVGESFAGAFDYYFASVLNDWQRRDCDDLVRVGEDLQDLSLTWRVEVEEVSDVALSIRVARLPRQPPRGGTRDLVNMADVGFGVSQALPVVVALRVASPGDTVYVEQPELHLHPRAQVNMAGILAHAAKRGVQVIAETHSSLLLLGVQTMVAEGKLNPDLVKLHWFQRDKQGATIVAPADLDQNGAFGSWPEDFDNVALEADKRYLDAVERQAARR